MMEKTLYNKILKNNTDYNVWFAFPECNSFSLSSLGYMWLYKELDELEHVFVERINTDTVSTQIMSSDVDALAFSFSFDFDFLNIFKIMEKFSIQLKRTERNEQSPFVFAGGPVLTCNPMPYSEIFDFIIIGDGEGLNTKVIEICRENRHLSKNAVLELLSELEGVYVPSIHKTSASVKKSHSDLNHCVYTPLLSDESFFKNTFIIETSRGCYNRCGFCIASYLNLPARFVDYDTIIEKLELGLKYTNKIALLGALVSAHPRFNDICKYIDKKIVDGQQIEMSISSLRADTITPDVVKTLVDTGQKHITIAIESASEHLRRVINKNITEEQLFKTIKIAKENGLKGVKIYCMIGLPTETPSDIDEFLRLAKDLKSEFKGFELTFSFSTFVPKPHTPFQWFGRKDTKELEKIIKYLSKEFHKIGVDAKFSSPKWDYYQTLLSKGDEKLTDYLIAVYKAGGKIGAFKNCAKTLKIDTDDYVLQDIDLEADLPWDVISIETPGKELLKKEYKRLMKRT